MQISEKYSKRAKDTVYLFTLPTVEEQVYLCKRIERGYETYEILKDREALTTYVGKLRKLCRDV